MSALIRVYFEKVEDMILVAVHVEELLYSVTTNDQSKALTLDSASAFEFVQQFCAIFEIPMTFWIEMLHKTVPQT